MKKLILGLALLSSISALALDKETVITVISTTNESLSKFKTTSGFVQVICIGYRENGGGDLYQGTSDNMKRVASFKENSSDCYDVQDSLKKNASEQSPVEILIRNGDVTGVRVHK